ncbi:hypothetical protein CWS01_10105 [Niallia nealsonii]|uniref:Cytochrome P450 n=2 Tax=Niallia nealsonii TaxID=115979 RepID=A0A2N0Z2X5_9BACI|nr:hypothetical protein CWS01_10105 [Niallia nealsonii]
MYRKPEYFQNPTSFIPERFENNFIKTILSCAFFPFGGGPRVCISNHFGSAGASHHCPTIPDKFA